MMLFFDTTTRTLQSLHRLDQRRGCASLQLEEVVDRAVGICSRASAIQRKVMQQSLLKAASKNPRRR